MRRPTRLLLALLPLPLLLAPSAAAQCGQVLFAEDFEGGALPPGWSATGLWHVSQRCKQAGVPDDACVDGWWAFHGIDAQCDYDMGSQTPPAGELTTPWFDLPALPGGGAILLEYCESEQTECHSPEWFHLDVDELGGGTTAYLIRCKEPSSWMDGTPPYPLTAHAGKTVRLRWRFVVGDSWKNDLGGIKVDNVTVRAYPGAGPDCNGNRVPDPCDIALGTSADCNGNGVPDECEGAHLGYCTSKLNSTGKMARLGIDGSVNLSCNDMVLRVTDAPPGQPGIFYFGTSPASQPFGDGIRCVGGTTWRLKPAVVIGTDGTGSLALDLTALPAGAVIAPGDMRYFQLWFRDPLPVGWGWNLSDARRVTFGP